MAHPYTIRRDRDGQGFRGISIMRGNVAIANIVMQLDDSELDNARLIVEALNEHAARQ